MVIMYPLQSQNDYTELLFSLRSIEKYFSKPKEIIIVGDRIPDWLTNVTVITVGDIVGRKQLTIKKKIIASLRIAEKIFFMNDDVYLLEETDGYSYPYYFMGSLSMVGESGARPLQDQLKKMKKPEKNFDIHQPLVYDQRFIEVFEKFPPDVIIKSCYCNFLNIEGIPYLDFKINKKMNQREIEMTLLHRNYFSTGPVGLGSAIPVLQKLFPDKSKYEV